jgi:DNA-binding Lrp family transcriptional regulator
LNALSEIIELIASKRVRHIINSLAKGPKTLTELSSELSISKPALLKHSNQMQALGIITSERIKTSGGRENRYVLNPFSFHFVANEGIAFSVVSFGTIDFEFPLLCQMPEERRGKIREAMQKMLLAKPRQSILLAGEEFLLLSDSWSDAECNSITAAVAPAKCLFWRYSDMNDGDSFTSRIKDQSIVLYSKDEKVFRNLKKYKNLEVKK